MKTKLRNTGIILSIVLICSVVVMSVFDLWTRFGIDKFLEKVAIVIAGFLGVVVVRMAIKLILEMIIWIVRKIKKSTHNNV
jgi:prepilin signal peptidase PulO-like enzyme (type II secretory pathway)